MNGVISESVSIGSSHRVASVTWMPHVMVPVGCASAGAAIRSVAATKTRAAPRFMGLSFSGSRYPTSTSLKEISNGAFRRVHRSRQHGQSHGGQRPQEFPDHGLRHESENDGEPGA